MRKRAEEPILVPPGSVVVVGGPCGEDKSVDEE